MVVYAGIQPGVAESGVTTVITPVLRVRLEELA
jgi:hypothetical protein